MLFFAFNVKLKLVEGFTMPKQEYIKGVGNAKGEFRKIGNETVPMYKLTFVQQDELKTSIVFNTKESTWNHFEEKNELLTVVTEVVVDPFTSKLKTPKLVGVLISGTKHPGLPDLTSKK